MSKRLDDINDELLCQIIRATGDYDYLRSATLKYLYAEKRLVSLGRKIADYKRRVEFRNGITMFPSTLSIEMDLDHCIASLRSSLEHLAQLINCVVKLGLQPTGHVKDKKTVSLPNVVEAIRDRLKSENNQYLSDLSELLSGEKDKDWYKELDRFRIEMYHHKSREILNYQDPRLAPNMMDELFLIPPDVAISAKTKRDPEICRFCQSQVNDIENVLYKSFYLLSRYLS
jgi:hypothetical protein